MWDLLKIQYVYRFFLVHIMYLQASCHFFLCVHWDYKYSVYTFIYILTQNSAAQNIPIIPTGPLWAFCKRCRAVAKAQPISQEKLTIKSINWFSNYTFWESIY